MADNNTIQILRGENIKSTAGSTVLLPGQPCYDMSTGYLYVGDNSSISSTDAVKASYANEAGHADSADTASNATYASNAGRASTANNVAGYLLLNNGISSVMWDGDENTTIYVPRTKGSSGQVWGMNGSNVGWINQTEVPGTIEHANTADTADYATSAGSATTSATANKLKNSLYLNSGSSNVAWDGSESNVIYVPTSRGVSGQVWSTTATGVGWVTPTPDPGNLSDIVYGRYVALNNRAPYQFTRQLSSTMGNPNVYYELPYVSGTSANNPATILINGAYANTFKSFGYYSAKSSASSAVDYTVKVSKSGTGISVNNNSILPNSSYINNYAFISFACDYRYANSGTPSNSNVLPVSTMPVSFFYDYIERSKAMMFCTDSRWFNFEPAIHTNGRLILGNPKFGGGEDGDYILVTVVLAGNLAEVV